MKNQRELRGLVRKMLRQANALTAVSDNLIEMCGEAEFLEKKIVPRKISEAIKAQLKAAYSVEYKLELWLKELEVRS